MKRNCILFFFTLLFWASCCSVAFAFFRYGDTGQQVASIQKRLAALQYEITAIDGDFGVETERAIRNFQADKGLDNDGIVGEYTYLALMNSDLPPDDRVDIIHKVIRTAYSVIGTPYSFGGASCYGFDCSGFTQYVFEHVGIFLPRVADGQLYAGRRISWKSMLPGDLIFFTTYEPGASHVGIYLGNGNFIHSGTSTGVTVSSALTGYWGARYYAACRII